MIAREILDMVKKGVTRPASGGLAPALETKKVRRTHGRKTAKKTADDIRIDYPADGEVVVSQNYSYRVSAAVAPSKVEVSINGGEWRPCREALGFWWFDWQGYDRGAHVVTARIEKTDGRFAVSAPRRFKVAI